MYSAVYSVGEEGGGRGVSLLRLSSWLLRLEKTCPKSLFSRPERGSGTTSTTTVSVSVSVSVTPESGIRSIQMCLYFVTSRALIKLRSAQRTTTLKGIRESLSFTPRMYRASGYSTSIIGVVFISISHHGSRISGMISGSRAGTGKISCPITSSSSGGESNGARQKGSDAPGRGAGAGIAMGLWIDVPSGP